MIYIASTFHLHDVYLKICGLDVNQVCESDRRSLTKPALASGAIGAGKAGLVGRRTLCANAAEIARPSSFTQISSALGGNCNSVIDSTPLSQSNDVQTRSGLSQNC